MFWNTNSISSRVADPGGDDRNPDPTPDKKNWAESLTLSSMGDFTNAFLITVIIDTESGC